MADAAKQNDDSMESILGSIRDIIADKTDTATGDAGDDDVLELTEMVAVPAEAPAAEDDVLSDIDALLGTPTPAPQPALEDEFPPEHPLEAAITPEMESIPEPQPAPPSQPEPQPEPLVVAQKEEPAPAPKPSSSKKHLVSDDSAALSTAALKELMKNLPKPKIVSPEFRSGNTVEDLVVEALKPMLSDWLDANLPLIVRELVQKEIEKLVPHESRS